MGLPPIETAQARIDTLFEIRDGELPQIQTPERQVFAKSYMISYYSDSERGAAEWLNEQFGTDL